MQLLCGGVTCTSRANWRFDWTQAIWCMWVYEHTTGPVFYTLDTQQRPFFFSSLVISLFDYISCSQRLVLLKNSYLGIPQPNPNLPRWSLVLCDWMSVFISRSHPQYSFERRTWVPRQYSMFCLWLCSLLCFLDCTLSSSLTPTTPASESGSTVKTLTYTYDLLTIP